jgi:hypothetical protein
MEPSRIFGVDFSGAQNAGAKIWIASAINRGDTLDIDAAFPAWELPGGSVQRAQAIDALRAFVVGQYDALFGLDFPFSLPRTLIQAETWDDFVSEFGARFPSDNDFLNGCRSITGGREYRRQTDKDANTPFCPYNLRLYKQTYYGIRDLLAPLVVGGNARILPFHPVFAGISSVIEICPASTLKQDQLYLSYKGNGEDHWHSRFKILSALEARGVSIASSDLHRRLLQDTEGDALDAVIAAYSTWQALRDGSLERPSEENDLLEGRVYF